MEHQQSVCEDDYSIDTRSEVSQRRAREGWHGARLQVFEWQRYTVTTGWICFPRTPFAHTYPPSAVHDPPSDTDRTATMSSVLLAESSQPSQSIFTRADMIEAYLALRAQAATAERWGKLRSHKHDSISRNDHAWDIEPFSGSLRVVPRWRLRRVFSYLTVNEHGAVVSRPGPPERIEAEPTGCSDRALLEVMSRGAERAGISMVPWDDSALDYLDARA